MDEINTKDIADQFTDELKSLNATRSDSFRDFDRTLVTLSTASLGFTVIVAKDIFPVAKSDQAWAIILCWVLFALASIICLLSMLMSGYAHSREFDKLYCEFYAIASKIRKMYRSPDSITDVERNNLKAPFMRWYFKPENLKCSADSGEDKPKNVSGTSVDNSKARENPSDRNLWGTCVNIANWMCWIFFLAAVALFVYYVASYTPTPIFLKFSV